MTTFRDLSGVQITERTVPREISSISFLSFKHSICFIRRHPHARRRDLTPIFATVYPST